MSTTSNLYGSSDPNSAQDKSGQQQPGYIQQAYNAGANLLSSVVGTTTTDSTTADHNQEPHVGAINPAITSSSNGGFGVDYGNTGYGQQKTQSGGTGGVGDLGTTDTSNVALLPEERANPDPLTSAPGAATIGTSSHTGPQSGGTGGVGDLGTTDTSNVALLPEERANPDPLASAPGTATAGTYSTAGNSNMSKANSHWREMRAGDNLAVGDLSHPGHSGGITGSNHDTDHGLGMAHRADYESGGRDEGAVAAAAADEARFGTTKPQVNQPSQLDGEHLSSRTQDGAQGNAYQEGSQFANQDLDKHYGSIGGQNQQTDASEEGRRFAEQDIQNQQGSGNYGSNVDTADQSGSGTGPKKIDKLKGQFHIAKGKLLKDPEEIAQGESLKATGKHVDIDQEIRDGKYDDVLAKPDQQRGVDSQTANNY